MGRTVTVEKVNLSDKLKQIAKPWQPHVVGELNGQQVKLAKLEGEFTWHQHDNEDELFYVVSGRLTIELRGKAIELNPGEFCIVPRGVEHRPVARPTAEVMLFEPATTVNTGNATDPRRVEPDDLKRL